MPLCWQHARSPPVSQADCCVTGMLCMPLSYHYPVGDWSPSALVFSSSTAACVTAAMHTSMLLRTCGFVQPNSGSFESALIQPAYTCQAPGLACHLWTATALQAQSTVSPVPLNQCHAHPGFERATQSALPFLDGCSYADLTLTCETEPIVVCGGSRYVHTCRFVEPLRTGLPFLDGRIALKPGHLLEVVGPSGSAKSELLLQVRTSRSRGGMLQAAMCRNGIGAGESQCDCEVQGGLHDMTDAEGLGQYRHGWTCAPWIFTRMDSRGQVRCAISLGSQFSGGCHLKPHDGQIRSAAHFAWRMRWTRMLTAVCCEAGCIIASMEGPV